MSLQPLAKRCRLQPRDAARLPESAWKLLFYLACWSYCAYLLLGTSYPFFHDPPSVFFGKNPVGPVQRTLWSLLRVAQASLTAQGLSLGPTWWKGRTENLFSNLHMYTVRVMHTGTCACILHPPIPTPRGVGPMRYFNGSLDIRPTPRQG